MNKTPFSEFIVALQQMTPQHKNELINNYKMFGSLKSFCEAKKYIEILPGFKGIKVLKNKKEVKELKKVIDSLKPGGFIWENTAGIDELAKEKSGASSRKKK